MTQATAVPVSGFGVPPAAPGTLQHSRNAPSAPVAPPAAPPAAPAAAAAPEAPQVPAVPRVPGHTTESTTPQDPEPQKPGLPQPPTEEGGLNEEVQAYLKAAIAEAKKAPNAEPPKHEPTTFDSIDVDKIESPQVRELGKLLLTAMPNASLDKVFGKAFEYNDPTLVNAEYIRQVGGENATQLVQMAQQLVRVASAEIDASVQSVYSAAGGEAQWQAAVAAFNKNAPKHLKTVAVKLLDSPNRSDIQEGAKFVIEFARQGGFVAEEGERITSQAGAGLGERGLSSDEFKNAWKALKPAHSNPNRHQEEAELLRLRQLGKNRGL